MVLPPNWRFPDKPTHAHKSILDRVPRGNWTAQAKKNGWRFLSYVDDTIETYSRRGRPLQQALKSPVNSEVIKQLKELRLDSLTLYDGEYLGRREVATVKTHHAFLFDIMMLNLKWITNWPYVERLGKLIDLFEKRLKGSTIIQIPESADSDFLSFYESIRNQPTVDGIVVKDLQSTLIASRKDCKDNPRWFKVRYNDEIEQSQPVAASIKAVS